MERGLVLHGAAENGLDGLDLHVEALEPGGDLLSEPAPHPDLVATRAHHLAIVGVAGVTEPHPERMGTDHVGIR